MKNDKPLIIFGYAFPHRKTYDFINILCDLGFKNIIVIGAPKVQLSHNEKIKKIDNYNINEYCVKSLCRSLEIRFEECAHDNFKKISKIINEVKAKTAIISGARIIKREIIELFKEGIINFHPGKIPETSGLDSFYYTIKNNCKMGVTVHLIDHKVDAGKFIFFESLNVEPGQSIELIKDNLYNTQLVSLKKYINNFFEKKMTFPEINRPKKNLPLSNAEKDAIITRIFPRWISHHGKK